MKIGGVEEPVRNVTLRLTQLFNVTGHPAITIPCGKTTDGLPIGAQLAGADVCGHIRNSRPAGLHFARERSGHQRGAPLYGTCNMSIPVREANTAMVR